MNFDGKSIAIGVAAGFAAALLSVGSVVQTSLSLLLFFVAPLPVLVAGLGWGSAAGMAGVVASFAGVASFASVLPAAVIAVTITIPAAALAYLASLAKTAPDGELQWYPLGGILFRLALMLSAGFIMVGLMVGYDAQSGKAFADAVIKQVLATNPDIQMSAENQAAFTSFLTRLLPFLEPSAWLLIMLANFYLGLALARLSGRLKRPRDFWPLALRMPRPALTLLAVAMALTFVSGGVGYAASVPSGAFIAAFCVSGLAAFHAATLGKPWRFPALWMTYVAIILASFLIFPFFFAGLYVSARRDTPLND